MEDNPYENNVADSGIANQGVTNRNFAAKAGFAIGMFGFACLLATNLLYYYGSEYGFGDLIVGYLKGEREVFAPSLLFPIGFAFSIAGLYRTPRRMAIIGALVNGYGALMVPSYVTRCLLEQPW